MGCLHCERQVKVVGLQKPTQHWASCWQAALAAVQATARHRPALHVPSQQSFASLQGAPVAPQELARHKFPAQVEPVQQSEVAVQVWPGFAQVPSPRQRLERQVPEQHTVELEHVSPLPPQPQSPSRHDRSQQSEWKRQASPRGRQASRH